MPANDPMQRLSDAVAAVIEADAGVQAITGRASGNIMRYNPRSAIALPGLAYLPGEATIRGGLGENYDIPLTLRAEATTTTIAHALLKAAIDALTVANLEAAGADAVVEKWSYSDPEAAADGDPASTNPDVVIAIADLTIWLTM
jgi:hypothetical protein